MTSPPCKGGSVAANSDMPGACRSREAGSRSEPWGGFLSEDARPSRKTHPQPLPFREGSR